MKKKQKKVKVLIHQHVAGEPKKSSVSTVMVPEDSVNAWTKMTVRVEPNLADLKREVDQIAYICRKSAEVGATTKEDYIRERLTTKLLEVAQLLDKVGETLQVSLVWSAAKEKKS